MQSAVVFFAVFGGLFVLRMLLATAFFLWVLPEGDECPVCNSVTVRVRSKVWNVLFPKMRPSWCYECGWEGLLRPDSLTDADILMIERTVSRR